MNIAALSACTRETTQGRRAPTEAGVLNSRLYRFLFALLLIAAGVMPAVGLAQAAPVGCVADWYVSYGGTNSYVLVHSDPEDLPLSALHFSRSYNDPTDLSKGYLDFNQDGKSDVFSAVPIGGGDYRWRYSSAASTNWIPLAFDSTPPDQLRFGDFNGDGYTDVFSVTPIGGGNYRWKYSPGGDASYVNLAYDSTPLDQLRFGDFNADGKTDVFTILDLGAGKLGWEVSYSGTTNYEQINKQTTPLSDMQFGDINDDGHTDVFTSVPSTTTLGANVWEYASDGHGEYQPIVIKTQSVHDVILAGNFDISTSVDFGGTDFFYTAPRLDGNNQWWYFHDKNDGTELGDVLLAYDSTPPDQLRFGDFNADRVTDVFTLKQRCTLNLPLIVH